MGCFDIKVLELIKKNVLMKKIFFLFLIFFSVFPYLIKADSSKIYKKGYANPINSLSTFLWNKKKKGSIGLTSIISINNRELGATLHPVSLDSSKIKIALSKIKYIDEKKEHTDFIFNEENLEVLSKYASKGLRLANKNQDITFQFINKKEKENTTEGIIFAQKKSLNLVFFQIHGCSFEKVNSKKNFNKKKKEFHKNHPNFSFVKTNKKCNEVKKITVTSSKGIYKRKTNQSYSWLIFTSPSWELNTIN